MQVDDNLIPVESDVNQFLCKERSLLDSDIADLFKEFKLSRLLKDCNIKKRCGHSVPRIVYDLFFVPFLLLSNVYLFVHTQYEKAASVKNKYYRLLENAKFNWRLFVMKISQRAHQTINSSIPIDELFYVLDDTITEVSGKLVEGASYIYDHVSGKSVLGFQKLVLGIFNGSQFIPISQRFCSSKKKPRAKSKASKYNKIPKAERIETDSPGAVEREQLQQTKLQKAIRQLKVGIKGPLTTPVGGGMRSLNVSLRQKLDLFVCLRPVRWFEGLPSPHRAPQGIDLVIFRENTEDLYTGIEYQAGTPQHSQWMRAYQDALPEDHKRLPYPQECGIGIKPISKPNSQRLVHAAIEWAVDNNRKRVTLVHKGNIMKYTEGAFRNWGYEEAENNFNSQVFTRRQYQSLLKIDRAAGIQVLLATMAEGERFVDEYCDADYREIYSSKSIWGC